MNYLKFFSDMNDNLSRQMDTWIHWNFIMGKKWKYHGKEPTVNVWKGEKIGTRILSITFREDQLDFLLPVEPVTNTSRHHICLRGNT